jgi:hypothetical protein
LKGSDQSEPFILNHRFPGRGRSTSSIEG